MTSVAVIARSSWIAMCPSPPAPTTTAVDPGGRSGTARLTARYAASPPSAKPAAWTGVVDGSSLTSDRALVRRQSANPPSTIAPENWNRSQSWSAPARHGPHLPQVR